MDIETRLNAIEERNNRVELDKAWEISSLKKLIIVSATYIVSIAWLLAIDEPLSWLKAVVPAAGYFLSTLSLKFVKNIWQHNK